MIEYCLELVQCDPDVEIKSTNQLMNTEIEQVEDDDDDNNNNEHEIEENEENLQIIDDTFDKNSISKPKETSIFSLLRTVSFIDNTIKHPLKIFLKKTKNINVHHHETHRTPSIEAIYLQEYKTTHMLINESSCDINLSTSIVLNERQQTPLKLHLNFNMSDNKLTLIRNILNCILIFII
jgi:hypothetical protein